MWLGVHYPAVWGASVAMGGEVNMYSGVAVGTELVQWGGSCDRLVEARPGRLR